MKGFIAGVVCTGLALGLGVYVYFAGGFVPVATAAQAMPFEKRLARIGLAAHVEKEAPTTVPIEANEENLVGGSHIYAEHCAVCHGLPDKPPTAIAQGMFPRPPKLLAGKGVTDDPPGESYWKIANGIRLTGMPAFNKNLSQTELWQVSLLVANADKLPAAASAVLTQKPPESAVATKHFTEPEAK